MPTRTSASQLDRDIETTVGKRIDRKKLAGLMFPWGSDFSYGQGSGAIGAVASYYVDGTKYPDRKWVERALREVDENLPKAEEGAHGWTKADAKTLRTIAAGLRYYLVHDYKAGDIAHSTVLSRKGTRHHSTISDDANICYAVARFPPTFGLRGFPGDMFRLSPMSSYISGGNVMLYTQRKEGDHWLDFSKGTEPELRGEIVPLPSAGGRATRSHASRLDRNIIVRPTSTRWPGGVKVRVVKFGADVRQGVRAVLPVGSFAVMHPDAGEKLPSGTVRVHEDDLRDTAD